LSGVPQHHVQRGNHRRLCILEPIGRLRNLEELRVAASQNARAEQRCAGKTCVRSPQC
jgi:hypothetical protein